jgi:hypothetical protein
MGKPKPVEGLSKHNDVYDSGPRTLHNAAAGMSPIRVPKAKTPNQGKKSDGKTRYLGK